MRHGRDGPISFCHHHKCQTGLSAFHVIWECVSFLDYGVFSSVHRGAFCQFLFRWIYYCHSSKSTEKETGKMHLCTLWWSCLLTIYCGGPEVCLIFFRHGEVDWILLYVMCMRFGASKVQCYFLQYGRMGDKKPSLKTTYILFDRP